MTFVLIRMYNEYTRWAEIGYIWASSVLLWVFIGHMRVAFGSMWALSGRFCPLRYHMCPELYRLWAKRGRESGISMDGAAPYGAVCSEIGFLSVTIGLCLANNGLKFV